jgi:poly(A) polymerase
MGDIQKEAISLIDEIFKPFFLLPRRMRGAISSILSLQYRLTPIEKKRGRRVKIPNDPDFPEAMQFFNLRRSIEPGLEKIWDEWNALYQEKETPHDEPPKKTRRRRRRRPSS